MKYYFPVHLDGGNRGCEGIAKGTAIMLNEPKENLLGRCRDVELDKRLGIDKYVTLVPLAGLNFFQRLYNFGVAVLNKFHLRFGLPFITIKQDPHFYAKMKKEDLMLSTGGDMLCYSDNLPSVTSTKYVVSHGHKAILWGCSMGAKNLTPVKEEALRSFSLIYARESLTYDFFKSIGLKNVVCLPDPAFVLEPEEVQLPECFQKGDVIGMNLSNYTVGADDLNTPFGEEVKKFVEYVMTNTNKHLLMVPHVFWPKQEDILVSNAVKESFPQYADRISILDSNSMNYLQIRYVISKCWCFVGGRTHAVVSAYSTCVPAIALGYSIKSRGIAKDLNQPEQLVIDCVSDIKPNCLVDSFKYLASNYDNLKQNLETIMPDYRKKPFEIRDILKDYGLVK